jgi:ferredoxin
VTSETVSEVHVLPADAVLEVREGESVFQAAQRQDWRWPTTCHGAGECGMCFMLVDSGVEHLNAPAEAERQRLALGMAATKPNARLACATRPRGGPIEVTRKGARPRPPTPAS